MTSSYPSRNRASAITKYTTTCAGSSRDRFSFRSPAAMTSSTMNRGTVAVSTPIDRWSVKRPDALKDVPEDPESVTARIYRNSFEHRPRHAHKQSQLLKKVTNNAGENRRPGAAVPTPPPPSDDHAETHSTGLTKRHCC